ncbi:unannotated protein [freshwater metagenome]|uniref:Unannotated protein n=1 Tax=freshwater metagenome TaxID=449393 RepID=A0A6J7RVV2_9ZZZZ
MDPSRSSMVTTAHDAPCRVTFLVTDVIKPPMVTI